MTTDLPPPAHGSQPAPGATPGPGSGAPRWMKLLLGLSLAANLAVAGIVAGAILKDGPPRRDMMARDLGFGAFSEALSPDDRAALKRAFAERAPEFRDRWREIRVETRAFLDMLRAEPFDPAGLKALMDSQHARATERFELGRGLLYDRIVAMSAPERAAFADRLEKGLKRGHKEGGHKDGGAMGKTPGEGGAAGN